MNGNDPAQPIGTSGGTWKGLTKREYFTLEIAKALARAGHIPFNIADAAVEISNKLMEKLP